MVNVSASLIDYLQKIPQTKEIIQVIRSLENPPIDYLDIDVKDGAVSISFLDTKRAKSVKSKNEAFTSKLRQAARVGKVLKRISPEATDDDIRNLTEAIQGIATENEARLFTVEGDEIRKIWQIPKAKCTKNKNRYAVLQMSCYQGIVLDTYCELYVRNPDKIKMLVCMVGNLLDGRAMFYLGKENGKKITRYESIKCNTEKNRTLMARWLSEHKILSLDYTKEFVVEDLVPGRPIHHADFIGYKDGKLSNKFPTSVEPMSNVWWDKKMVNHYADWKAPED